MLSKVLEGFLAMPVYLLKGIANGIVDFLAMWGYCLILSKLWEIMIAAGRWIGSRFQSAGDRIRQYKAKHAEIKTKRLQIKAKREAKPASDFSFPAYYTDDAAFQKIYHPEFDRYGWFVRFTQQGFITVRMDISGYLLTFSPEGWQLYPSGGLVSDWFKAAKPEWYRPEGPYAPSSRGRG